MKMNFETYKNKVQACWLGKNIGGTLGAPFECNRGVVDLDYYTHDLKLGVLPNDDLELQLVWLNAAERYGKEVNAKILGEYWLSYITAEISEYGTGMNNMKAGICPPLSGWYHNHNKDSNGAFIRSEIWACLAPGHPEIATRYAREDAIVDHADEGLYGELFCAAVESAAFCESDMHKLVEIGLSYIPDDCAVAGAIRLAIKCYEDGLDWKAARKKMLQTYPGSFGAYNGYKYSDPEPDVPTGELGFDVPSNIGIMMIGWIYGEGDFSKSICIAAGCCEDGDCTAGTLGSILGIIGGTEIIDEKWLAPIGDEIKTSCLCMTKQLPGGATFPATVTQFTERVIKLMPTFMHGYFAFNDKGEIELDLSENLADKATERGPFERIYLREELCVDSRCVTDENTILKMRIEYDKDINIRENEEKNFKIYIDNKVREPHWLNIKWHVPETWKVYPAKEMPLFIDQAHGGYALTEAAASIIPAEMDKGKYEVLVEVSALGRHSKLYLPVTLMVTK